MNTTLYNIKGTIKQVAKVCALFAMLCALSIVNAQAQTYEYSANRKVYHVNNLPDKSPEKILEYLTERYLDDDYRDVTDDVTSFYGRTLSAEARYQTNNQLAKEAETIKFEIDHDDNHLVYLYTKMFVVTNWKVNQSPPAGTGLYPDLGYQWIETTKKYGKTYTTSPFNMVAPDFKHFTQEKSNSKFTDLTGVPSVSRIKYFEKDMPLVSGYRGATKEIRKLIYFKNAYTSGVVEVRAIPDDYSPTVYSDYIYYHGGADNTELMMQMVIDNCFGPDPKVGDPSPSLYWWSDSYNVARNPDMIPIRRNPAGNGMQVEYTFNGSYNENILETRKLFTYTVPVYRGRQEIQYVANLATLLSGNEPVTKDHEFWEYFDTTNNPGWKATGVEKGSFRDFVSASSWYLAKRSIKYVAPNEFIMELMNPQSIFSYSHNSAMGFKDKGKFYNQGDLSVYTIIQGVAAAAAPEMIYENGRYDFDGEIGQDFNVVLPDASNPTNKLRWSDYNPTAEMMNSIIINNNKSTGGTLYRMRGTVAEKVATYTTANKFEGDFVVEKDATGVSKLLIPGSEITGLVNTFDFEIQNSLEARGRHSIFVYTPVGVDVKFKDENGRDFTDTDPLIKDNMKNYVGRVGDRFTLLFPEKLSDGAEFIQLKDIHGNTLASNRKTEKIINGVKHFELEMEVSPLYEEITVEYEALTDAVLVIKFELANNDKEEVVEDFNVSQTAYKQEVVIHLMSGTTVEDEIAKLTDTSAINPLKLNAPGYEPIIEKNYYFKDGTTPTRPYTIPTGVTTTVVYKYYGAVKW